MNFYNIKQEADIPTNSFSCSHQNPIACILRASTLGLWVIDSHASDHISGNRSLWYDITYFRSLGTDTIVNGSQNMVIGVGQANP